METLASAGDFLFTDLQRHQVLVVPIHLLIELRSGFERIADSDDGADERMLVGIGLHPLADVGDHDAEIARIHVVLAAPNAVGDRPMREDAVWVSREVDEHVELRPRQFDR